MRGGRMSRFDHEAAAMLWMAGLLPCLRVTVVALETCVAVPIREFPASRDSPSDLLGVTTVADPDRASLVPLTGVHSVKAVFSATWR